ncbi:MAG: phosphatidate cytidylyltransferase, partial [Proteobacteria bacterium]|nr:phosphatidate cytidylyltransferase [Pseudomonadota bacterium]
AISVWMVVYLSVWLTAIWWLKNHQIGYQNKPHQLWIKSTFGLVAMTIFALALNHIHQLEQGNWWTLILFLLIWLADIGAYISGKTFGRRKLSPKISPGKTWEGVIGALVFVLLFAAVVSLYMPVSLNMALTGFALIALFSVVGDLSASLAKRQAGVKDSSNLLPGHGGFIDRFDSLIAAAPIFSALLAYAL